MFLHKERFFMKLKNLLFAVVATFCFVLNAFCENMPEVIESEDEEPMGIKLNLPQELISDCKDSFWRLQENEVKDELDTILTSQESFEEWCNEQREINNSNPVELRKTLCKYAYILLHINESGYILDGDFCKRIELDRIFGSIHLKGATPCCCCARTELESYIECLTCILEYGF